jgi:hypothetical protein
MSGARSWLAAVLAVGYLVVMWYTGAYPERSQLVRFQAKGLLHEDPQRVESVTLVRDGKARTFARLGPDWQEDGRSVPEATRTALDNAVKFMRNAEPVRTLSLEDLKQQDPREFGLAPPQFTISLTVGGAVALEAGFGGSPPVGSLNYVGVIGRNEIYLLSHFVVEEWDKVSASPVP